MRKIADNYLFSRGALLGLIIAWVVLVGAVIWIVVLNVQLADQQARDTKLAAELCRAEKIQRSFLVGMALNQPGLDRALIRILQESLNQLPEHCP